MTTPTTDPSTTHGRHTSMTITTDYQLTHGDNCPADRDLDVTQHPDAGIVTIHCVDCAAHEARRTETGEVIPPPLSPGPFNRDAVPSLYDGIEFRDDALRIVPPVTVESPALVSARKAGGAK